AKDLDPELATRAHGARVVVAAGEVEDAARTARDNAENHGAVIERFVARHADLAAKRPANRFDAFHEPLKESRFGSRRRGEIPLPASRPRRARSSRAGARGSGCNPPATFP